jgi:hypothetical protein
VFNLAVILFGNMTAIIPHLGAIYGTLIFYAVSFVSMNYMWSFIFKKEETAYKWAIGVTFLFYLIGTAG